MIRISQNETVLSIIFERADNLCIDLTSTSCRLIPQISYTIALKYICNKNYCFYPLILYCLKAGIEEEQLAVAFEQEAVAIYCHCFGLKEDRSAETLVPSLDHVEPGIQFIIVDHGCGYFYTMLAHLEYRYNS